MTSRYSKHLPGFVFVTDILLLNFALYDANFMVYHRFHPTNNSMFLFLLANSCWLLVSTLSKSYQIPRPLVLKNNFDRFLTTFAYHLIIVLGVIFFLKLNDVSRRDVFFTYSLFSIFIIIDRSLLFYFLDYIRKRGYNQRQIVIIGDKNIAKKLLKSFEYHPEYGYELKAVFTEERIAGKSMETLGELLLQQHPHEIFICYKEMKEDTLNFLISLGEAHQIKIKIATDLSLAANAELIRYDNIPLLRVINYPDMDVKVRLFKRLFDVVFSIVVMTMGAPIFLLLAVITRFTSSGPVFYKQERIGKRERPFYLYKFRSMYVDSESFGPQLSSDHDPRITRWGRIIRKTRLDELPQFWNVLKGEMSVVGPRPERGHYIEQIVERKPYYKKLMCLKPGLTSSGQVHYGYAENVDQMCDRVNYDLFYLNNMSFNRDINIILKTIKVMIQAKGK